MSNSFKQVSQEELPKLKIGCAADLFHYLRSNTMGVRLSVLAAISRNPAKALSYGPHHGTDLLTELCDQLNMNRQSTLRQALLGTLCVFKDARVAPVLRTVFRTAASPKEIAICAQRLAAETGVAVDRFFLDQLEPPLHPDRARWAANMLARRQGLTPADAVRVAVRCDVPFAPPLLDDATESVWLAALQGDCGRNARILLETMGEPAFRRMRPHWVSLDDRLKGWLLDWGARAGYARAVELCLDALEEEAEEVRLAALEAIARFGPARQLFRSVVNPLVCHPNVKIRAAALRAGAEVTDVRARLSEETDMQIRLLLVTRLASTYGASAAEDLLRLFEDPDWRIRSAAATGLSSLGVDSALAARDYVEYEKIEVRAAAARALDLADASAEA